MSLLLWFLFCFLLSGPPDSVFQDLQVLYPKQDVLEVEVGKKLWENVGVVSAGLGCVSMNLWTQASTPTVNITPSHLLKLSVRTSDAGNSPTHVTAQHFCYTCTQLRFVWNVFGPVCKVNVFISPFLFLMNTRHASGAEVWSPRWFHRRWWGVHVLDV